MTADQFIQIANGPLRPAARPAAAGAVIGGGAGILAHLAVHEGSQALAARGAASGQTPGGVGLADAQRAQGQQIMLVSMSPRSGTADRTGQTNLAAVMMMLTEAWCCSTGSGPPAAGAQTANRHRPGVKSAIRTNRPRGYAGMCSAFTTING